MQRTFVTAALLAIASMAQAQPLTTAFTLQGELRSGPSPASGTYDLRFRLYDAPTAGVQQGPTLCVDNAAVSEGRFAASLDFGPQFAGQQRFLEVEVRPDTGLNCGDPGGFVILTPRQALSAAPNASFALAAANTSQLGGQTAAFYMNAANLTGTLPPAALSGSYTAALTLSNTSNIFAGNGAALTGLNAANISTGTVSDARLSANVARLNGGNAFGNFTNSFLGNVGIGTTSPGFPLHIASTFAALALQDTGGDATQAGYISYRNTTGTETAWAGFGSPGDPNFSIVNARSGGGIILMPFSGNVGIGTQTPTATLEVAANAALAGKVTTSAIHGTALYAEATAVADNEFGAHFKSRGTNVSAGVWGEGSVVGVKGTGTLGGVHGEGPVGVEGVCIGSNGGFAYGVRGIQVFGLYGVFSDGNSGASGTKSFRIDHPFDPENQYLLHYCTESPEVLNAYRGTVRLDSVGEAVVELPDYFATINKDPSYTLTAVGAPMPMLHVAEKIDPAALALGEQAGPRRPGPVCSFRIAGGAPGMEVSWRIEAIRNDLWVRQHGAPVQTDKADHEKGTYQHPELYGLPAQKGVMYDRLQPAPVQASRGDIAGP